MKFIQHYSGSAANLYEVIATNGHRLIIDPGVTWKVLNKALNLKDNLSKIDACFVTHGHKDHCKCIGDVIDAGIDVYASEGTIGTFGYPKLNQRRLTAIRNKDMVKLAHFQVLCFDTVHDTPEPLGFVVMDSNTGEFLLFATDTKMITQRFKFPFSIVAIEASYCGQTLARKVKNGDINEGLAKRLLDSHMEITETLRYLDEFVNLSKCHEIHLLHMSGRNSDHAKARKQFYDKFMIDVFTVGKEN